MEQRTRDVKFRDTLLAFDDINRKSPFFLPYSMTFIPT